MCSSLRLQPQTSTKRIEKGKASVKSGAFFVAFSGEMGYNKGMKRKAIPLFFALPLVLTGCHIGTPGKTEIPLERLKGKSYSFYSFTVPVSVALFADFSDIAEAERTRKTVEEVKSLFSEIENSLSVSVETSAIARFNSAAAGEKVTIDEISYTVLGIAKKMYELTGGAYNPAVGMSVDLWGFTPRFQSDYEPIEPYDREVDGDGKFYSLPDEKYIAAFSTLSDFGSVEIWEENGAYYAKKPDRSVTIDGVSYSMRLDLGGIGKGYAADEGAALLRERGYAYGYLNVGSSSVALLKSVKQETDYAWNFGFGHPRGEGNYLELPLKDETSSTSGDYENFYMLDKVRYSHIIDPSTGRPYASDLVTATVYGLPAAEADALTTAILILGREKALALLNEKFPSVSYAMVGEEGGALTLSTNFETYRLLDEAMERKDANV